MRERSNVLITCGGKWVGMILQLRQAMQTVEPSSNGRIIVAAMTAETPAGSFADESVVVPPIADPGYVDSLVDVCDRYNIRVLVPLIDLDVERLSSHIESFRNVGTSVVCPSP